MQILIQLTTDQSTYYKTRRERNKPLLLDLAPAFNYEKDFKRRHAMKSLSIWNSIIKKFAPGQVDVINDIWHQEPLDIFKVGTSCHLIESGIKMILKTEKEN